MTQYTRAKLRSYVLPQLIGSDLDWPPRRQRGSVQNMRRAQLSALANHQWRVARMSDKKFSAHTATCDLCRRPIRWRKRP